MGGLLGSKPKAPAYQVPTAMRAPEPKPVPKPVVVPKEDEGALAENRRREAARQAARGGLASTVMAEDKLG